MHSDTAGPCVFLSAEAPSDIKASVRRVPAFPGPPSQPPPSRPDLRWPPAQKSANSPALCAVVAHDLFWHRRPSSQRHPRLYCSPVPPKNLLVPKRRHGGGTGKGGVRFSLLLHCPYLCYSLLFHFCFTGLLYFSSRLMLASRLSVLIISRRDGAD